LPDEQEIEDDLALRSAIQGILERNGYDGQPGS